MNLDLALAVVAGITSGTLPAYFTNKRAKRAEESRARIDVGGLELDGRRLAAETYSGVVATLRTELNSVQKALQNERDGRTEDNRRHETIEAELRRTIEGLRDALSTMRTDLEVTRSQIGLPSSRPPTPLPSPDQPRMD